jgi:perosamine synthetase
MTFIPQFQPLVLDSYIKDVSAQMKSGWVGPGKKVEEFEKRISEISGAKHVVSTTSGTMAIVMALESLNIPKGSTVLF